MSYIYSNDESDYLFFKNDISIPKGDSIAREALAHGDDIKIARIGFLMGGNHQYDLPEMIWFYQQFKNRGVLLSGYRNLETIGCYGG